jgi:HPr kinase/phosphorylase
MKTTKVQAVLVSVNGVGVLIRGPAGSGKSMAALNLMRHGHPLVGDDLVEIVSDTGAGLIGRGVEPDVRIEVRGLGIYRAASLFPAGTVSQASIDLVVDLDVYDPAGDAGRTSPETTVTHLLDKDLIAVRVPVASGVDPSLLIELLAHLYKQRGTVEPS